MQYLVSFFRPEVLFNVRPDPIEALGFKILITLFSLCIIAGIAATYFIRVKKLDAYHIYGLRKIRIIFLTMGILGFLYALFAHEGALILSARIWFILWLIIAILWCTQLLLYFVKDVPRLLEERKKKKIFEKYLP